MVAVATCVALAPWAMFCLLMLGFSAMCTDDGDDSDCARAVAVPILLGVLGLGLAVLQLVAALRGRTTRSVLLRGLPVLVLAPLGVIAWSAFLASA